jgi:hypothetical protein
MKKMHGTYSVVMMLPASQDRSHFLTPERGPGWQKPLHGYTARAGTNRRSRLTAEILTTLTGSN